MVFFALSEICLMIIYFAICEAKLVPHNKVICDRCGVILAQLGLNVANTDTSYFAIRVLSFLSLCVSNNVKFVKRKLCFIMK